MLTQCITARHAAAAVSKLLLTRRCPTCGTCAHHGSSVLRAPLSTPSTNSHSRRNSGSSSMSPSVAQAEPAGQQQGGSASALAQAGVGGKAAARAALTAEQRQAIITDSIRGIPDFPKPGILFWDVTTLLLNPEAFQLTIDAFVERYHSMAVDVVAGFEARGLIFGAPLALALGVPFVPLRKPGKLPGETVSEAYVTEYSTDTIEMHTGAVQPGQRVLLVDDLIATGGTLKAGINLIHKVGAKVVEAACVIELPALKGREKLEGLPLFVLIEKEGE